MTKYLLTLNLFLAFQLLKAQGVWTQKANLPASPRCCAASLSIGSRGYVGLGYDGSTHYNDWWEFNPSANVWTQKAGLPSGRYGCSGFSIGGKGYVCLGITQFAVSLTNEVWEYDQPGNIWTKKTNFPGAPRYGAAGFSMNGKGYVCCGNEGSASGPFTNEFWEYDPAMDWWIQKTNFPGVPRYGINYSCFVANNKAYVGLGGNLTSQYNFFNDFYSYDPVLNLWLKLADYPGNGNGCAIGFSACGKGYIGTGQTQGIAYSDFWQYDIANDLWRQVADFSGGKRWTMACFTINGKSYAGTGWDFNHYYNDWWEFDCDVHPSALAEIKNPEEILIYPNPSCGKFQIQSSDPSTPLRVTAMNIFNAYGEKIYEKAISEQRLANSSSPSGLSLTTIDLSSQPKGIYFIQMGEGSDRRTKKIIIE